MIYLVRWASLGAGLTYTILAMCGMSDMCHVYNFQAISVPCVSMFFFKSCVVLQLRQKIVLQDTLLILHRANMQMSVFGS